MKWIGISSCATRAVPAGRRGFTLTEIAIVLGVIGLILGGLWALAAQSWENQRQEQLKEEIFNAVKNIRAYYANMNGIPAGTFTTLTPTLINANVIAGDMVRRPPNTGGCTNANSFCADHPWGVAAASLAATGSFGICGWQLGTTVNCTAGAASSQQLFAIELQGMPLGSCIKAAMLNSGAGAPAGFYDVVINKTSMVGLGHGLPVRATDAEANCNSLLPATMDFIYRVVAPQF